MDPFHYGDVVIFIANFILSNNAGFHKTFPVSDLILLIFTKKNANYIKFD